MAGLPEGFTIDAGPSGLPEGFKLDEQKAVPSRLDNLTSTVTDIPHKIYEAGAEALGAMNRGLNPFSDERRASVMRQANAPSFMSGLGESVSRLGDTGAGALAVPALAMSPVTGTARSVLGHGMEAIVPPLSPEEEEKYKAVGAPLPKTGDEIADTALMGLAPARGGLSALRNPVSAPTPPAPNGPLGVTLSEGQTTGELPLIRAEQAAKRGQMGPQAEGIASEFADQQTGQLASAKDRIAQGFDQFGQTVAETPQEAGQLVSDAVRTAADQKKAAVKQQYDYARSLPGEIQAKAFDDIGTAIKTDLSGRAEPVIIDDKLTPYASRAIDDVEQRIAQLRIQNKASPTADPDRASIAGVNLNGVDQMRKRLSTMRKDAYSSGNSADGRATQAVLDAFDDHIDKAINGGMFKGDPRAVEAWNDARAAYADYRKTFTAGKNDPVGRVVEKIIGKDGNPPAIANDVADYLYGAPGVNPSSLNVGVAKRVRSILGDQSPEWSAVRQGLFFRLIEAGPGQTEWGPGKVSQRLNKFLNSDGKEMAEGIFTPPERAMLQSYADLQRKLEVPKTGANWSETSTFVAPMFKKLSGAVATGIGAVLGHMAAPGMMGEAAGAVAGSQVAKVGDRIANARHAKTIARQMPLVSQSATQYQRALTNYQKANTPLNQRTLALATTNLARSLEPLGIKLESLWANSGTVNAPASDDQQQ
jgi:hypothetical protein